MYPIDTYRITPNLFGHTRWQAEALDQRSRFARRAYSPEAAHMKMSADEELTHLGRFNFWQNFWLPASAPVYKLHDKICRIFEDRRRRRRHRKN